MQFNNKFRIFGLIIGVLVLVGLVGVMALTVQRAQQLTSTITRPKAAGNFDKTQLWPACAPGGAEPGCCKNIAAGGVDACGWPERGWCSEAECNAAKSGGGPNTCSSCADANDQGCEANQCATHCRNGPCTRNGQTYAEGAPMGCTQANRGCNCGLYVGNPDYCKQPPVCNTGKAVSPFPAIWQEGVSLKTSLKWMFNPFPSGGGGNAYVNVYLWSCQAKTDDCMVFGSVAGPNYDAVATGQFYKPSGKGGNFQASEWDGYYVKSLKPNTQYWWVVTPGIVDCGVQIYADTWTFTTGVTATPHYGCVGKTCAVVSGATTDANGCTAAGGTCCSGASDCATGQTCDTTKTPNACVTTAVQAPIITVTTLNPAYEPWAVILWGNNLTSTIKAQLFDVNGTRWGGDIATVLGVPNPYPWVSFQLPADSPPSGCNATAACSGVTVRAFDTNTGLFSSSLSIALPVAPCPTGQTSCGGVCKNLQTDPANCGVCGKACLSGQVCTNGSCVAGSSTCNVDSDCSGGTVCAFP